jgi:hypothetical protein
MIAWFLSLLSWFSKLSWVAKIISFVPIIKQYWHFIIIGILIVYVGILKFEIIRAENEYLKLKNEMSVIVTELKEAKNTLEIKQNSAVQTIKENTKAAKEKIETVKRVKNENISAIDTLRSHF